MKVVRDDGKTYTTIYSGTKKQCEKYVLDILIKNKYKYHVFTDIHMRSVFEVYASAYGPKSFCIFFKNN